MRNRLLIISTMYPSKQYPSFGIFIRNQVEQIKQKGYEVDLLVIKNPKMGKINLIAKYSTWLIKYLILALTNHKQYSLIHAHYVFPSGFLGLLMKKITKTPLVVTAHGGDIDKMAKKNKIIRHFTDQILQEADHVIAVGERLKQQLIQDYEVNESKLSMLNMGVDRSIFHPMNEQQIKHDWNLEKKEKIILFVGNIIRAKGLEELIIAYKKLKNEPTSLYIIGEKKDPTFYKEITSYLEEHRLHNIHLMPPLSQKEIAKWMNAADLFVIPSHMEGFGLVALEAMSCHTPVIGSDVGGLTYLLAQEAGVLVEAKNPKALAQAMEQVISNQTLQQQLIVNGEKKANRYDKENVINELLTIYHQLIFK